MKEKPKENRKMASAHNGRRRETHDLVVEILTLAGREERKSHIAAKVGLCTSQSKRFFDGLKQAGFITENSHMWKTTDKGKIAMEACELCRKIVRELP